jgi:hypothetical protein
MKKTKAAKIAKMLDAGNSVAVIKRILGVSESYIYAIKKQIAGMVDEVIDDVIEQVEERVEPKPEPEVIGVDKVLDARADQYGSFMQGADIAVRIKGIMHNAIARKDMHLYPDQLLALDMIAVKISRIVNGNASHRDSWLDIAGYAKLVADRLGGISR